jgi:hypothetical protein
MPILSTPSEIARVASARLLDAVREVGLGRYIDALAPLLRTAIAIRTRDASALDERVGASRLGGSPDLPEELPWPADADGPLPFIAQFDLASLAPFDIDHRLPRRGLLAFFGGYGDDGPRGRVLHLSELALVPRAAPAGVETEMLQGVELSVRVELPPYTSRFVALDVPRGHYVIGPRTGASEPLSPPLVPMPVDDHVRYADVYDRHRPELEGGRHGFFGYDRPMEGALRPNEVVLLRLDADGTVEHPFIEATVLYFLIDRAALARGELAAACFWYGSTL